MSTLHIPIEIEIPASDDGEEIDLVEYFSQFIVDSQGDLGGDLIPALHLYVKDDRAVVDSVVIEDVELNAEGVAINYTYTYSAYYGCRDMNYADSDWGTVFGKKIGENWVFEHWVRPLPRSTHEEY